MKTGTEVLVNLSTGEAFQGRILSVTPWTIRLRDFAVLEGSTAHPAAGVARIRRSCVTWIQEF